MRITTIVSNKGGVGKTTTAHALAAGLARKKKKVLALDLDPQRNLTFTTGYEASGDDINIFDLFTRHEEEPELVKEAIVKTNAGFYLLPGSRDLAIADIELTTDKKKRHTRKEYHLTEILTPIMRDFDYIIIDSPRGALGVLTVNALTVSDDIIIPIEADIYSLQGLIELKDIIQTIHIHTNTELQTAGLLITRYSPRAKVTKTIEEALDKAKKQLNTKIYKARIRETVAIKESHLLQQDIFSAYPKHKVTQDYSEFIREYMKER